MIFQAILRSFPCDLDKGVSEFFFLLALCPWLASGANALSGGFNYSCFLASEPKRRSYAVNFTALSLGWNHEKRFRRQVAKRCFRSRCLLSTTRDAHVQNHSRWKTVSASEIALFLLLPLMTQYSAEHHCFKIGKNTWRKNMPESHSGGLHPLLSQGRRICQAKSRVNHCRATRTSTTDRSGIQVCGCRVLKTLRPATGFVIWPGCARTCLAEWSVWVSRWQSRQRRFRFKHMIEASRCGPQVDRMRDVFLCLLFFNWWWSL